MPQTAVLLVDGVGHPKLIEIEYDGPLLPSTVVYDIPEEHGCFFRMTFHRANTEFDRDGRPVYRQKIQETITSARIRELVLKKGTTGK